MPTCIYCRCDVYDHGPVFVSESTDDDRVEADAFCNYRGLAAHVEEARLATGTSCRVDP